jgi:uncharacterized membrane protein YgdD (TMEM256/DUF423 family)
MTQNTALRVGAVLGALAVALGAFGAHGLKQVLETNGTTAIWEKAVFYHFIHALMLCWLGSQEARRSGPWWSFLVGILIFSGSLYLLSVTGERRLGAITPLGGVSFLVGWGWLAISPGRGPRHGVNQEK